MKYENAGDVIPEELLKELQKYAAGRLLYIPTGEEKKAWGETSGTRELLLRRNLMMRNKYAHGVTVSELADEYFLSLDSVKKIIYAKKNETPLLYEPTVDSAVQYASIGMLEEWMQCYLQLTHKGTFYLHEFTEGAHLYFGVVKFPLRLIESDAPRYQVEKRGEGEDDLSPLLVLYKEGKFYPALPSTLFSEIKKRKVNAYPSIIAMNRDADYKRFMKYYGNVLIPPSDMDKWLEFM